MYFKGFKIAVSINFLILVCIGMILTNIVVTFFWQQHAVNLSVDNARAYLYLLNLNQRSFCESKIGIDTFLEEINRNIQKESVITLIVSNQESFYAANKSVESNVKMVLMQAHQSQS